MAPRPSSTWDGDGEREYDDEAGEENDDDDDGSMEFCGVGRAKG